MRSMYITELRVTVTVNSKKKKTDFLRITLHRGAFANYYCRGKTIKITYLCECASAFVGLRACVHTCG
jgi:hypothetical protein